MKQTLRVFFIVFFIVGNVQAYDSIDLQGIWRAYGLASGPGAPWWERAVLTINSDGAFTVNSQESDGNLTTFSGTLNLSSDGIITVPEFPNIQGSMNADKSIIVWTDTWSNSQAGTTELKIFTKMATSNEQTYYQDNDEIGRASCRERV